MAITIRAMVYEATDGEKWNYRIYRNTLNNKWNVLRWPVGFSYIPPVASVLTIEGWQSVIGAELDAREFDTDREAMKSCEE